MLKTNQIDTPLGPLIAVADETFLYRLEFADACQEDQEQRKTAPIDSIEKELQLYFSGHLTAFQTPIKLVGSPFQVKVWEELQKIPLGNTCSYSDIAKNIGQPKAVRAVARANATNRLPIIIPCHRVIYADGTLGGYAGGVSKKVWLISHELKYFGLPI